jgi:hypothetical protein
MRSRYFFALTCLILFTPACVPKVDTYVNTIGAPNAPVGGFSFADSAGMSSDALDEAKLLVSKKLEQKGLSQDNAGVYLLSVTVSQRPANLSVKDGGALIASASSKPLNRR